MTERKIYKAEDCTTATELSPYGQVFVVDAEHLSEKGRASEDQLYFCVSDTTLSATGAFRAVSLKSGDYVRWNQADILGILRPELLSDSAKLQLSQILPNDLRTVRDKTPMYTGYCFLKDGRYASGVPLYSAEAVGVFIGMQKDYQHRVMVCDSEDFAVLEMVDGKLVYPTEEMLEKHMDGQEPEQSGSAGISQC